MNRGKPLVPNFADKLVRRAGFPPLLASTVTQVLLPHFLLSFCVPASLSLRRCLTVVSCGADLRLAPALKPCRPAITVFSRTMGADFTLSILVHRSHQVFGCRLHVAHPRPPLSFGLLGADSTLRILGHRSHSVFGCRLHVAHPRPPLTLGH